MASRIANRPILQTYPPGSLIARTAAIPLYRAYLDVQLAAGKLTAANFLDIRGKILGCFCKSKDCHGDIIAEFCQWFAQHPDATAGPPGRGAKTRSSQSAPSLSTVSLTGTNRLDGTVLASPSSSSTVGSQAALPVANVSSSGFPTPDAQIAAPGKAN